MHSSQEILIQHIEKYRAEQMLNYKELADNLNIPYTTLTEMLRKKRIPRIDTVDILAEAMGMDTYELFLPLNKGDIKDRKTDADYEKKVLAAMQRMPERKKKLLLLYLQLLEEVDSV